MRVIRNKKSGKTRIQYAHLIQGQYVFVELNDLWEVVS